METINESEIEASEQTVSPVAKVLGPKTQIDPESAEAFIAEKHIGERIKRLRLKKSMGLVELGRHTGLSASFLSQLETGRVVPTLRNLARIAMVFSKDLSYFFETEPNTLFRVHKKKERVRLPQTGVDDPTYYFESLGYMVPDRQLDPYYAEFIPLKKNMEVRPHVHPGYEFLYMLEGELEIRHADKVHIVEAGDGVYFDASTPHAYRCAGKIPAVAIIVTMHQQASSQPAMNLRPMGAMLGARTPQSGTSARPTINAQRAVTQSNGLSVPPQATS
ncbi:transcriptional regulator, XRE family [Acidisarcina polymorpha]|uniref:Transcriptional regulator, XRE family n=1 Tax=Acidisarcina polymorpha TaxID=2211140 RepID=A0A2Z5G299_9BACT|nr:XRE family transcriptional regulator [Acidisarcina polymorpha]AXC13160.1 transcriptional regulator, XRE family [Acidisarcina polymorpha]